MLVRLRVPFRDVSRPLGGAPVFPDYNGSVESPTDLPVITISPEILGLLRQDSRLANSMVNEILASFLKDERLAEDDTLVNRWRIGGHIPPPL